MNSRFSSGVILILWISSQVTIVTANVLSPLGTRDECTLSRDKLTGINKEINLALSIAEASSTQQVTNCQLNSSRSDNCNKLVQLLQCGVAHLKNGFIQALSSGVSLDEVNKWKTAYDTLSEINEKEKDSIRLATEQKYDQIVNDLKTELQSFNKSLTTAIENSTEKSVRLCISEIGSGRIESAISEFNSLRNNTKLVEIVKSVYCGYGNLDQVKNLGNFVTKLPSCAQDEIALPVLFEAMKESNHLKSPQVLILTRAVNQCMSSSSLANKVKAFSKEVIEDWAYRVATGDVQQIKDFAESSTDSFLFHEKDLIKQAYQGNLDKLEAVLNLIRNLGYVHLCVMGLLEVYEQMETNNHLNSNQILILNYYIKEVMEVPNFPNLPDSYKTQFAALKAKVTTNVDDLLDTWAASVRLGNFGDIIEFARKQDLSFKSVLDKLIGKIYSIYVGYAKPAMVFIRRFPYSSQSIRGFTALYENMKDNSHLDSVQLLMLAYKIKNEMEETSYTNSGQATKDLGTSLKNSLPSSVRDLIWSNRRKCTIKNYRYGEYLYTANGWLGHWIYSWVPGNFDETAYWTLHLREDGEYFVIENNYYSGRKLFVGDSKYDDQRRWVSTYPVWKQEDERIHWQIIPKGNKFLLLNIEYYDYLYADYDKRDEDRRYIFSWAPSYVPDDRKWVISC